MSNRTVIVTGANGGMGSQAVRQLAAAGWNVIGTTRGPGGSDPMGSIRMMQLDLCSKQSIEAFAQQLKEEGIVVDALFNNAGVLAHGYYANEEGYESTLCTNLIGPARLIEALIPCFSPDAHIVNMVSLACYTGFIKDDYFCHRDRRFHQIWRYSDSKLGFMLYSLELQEHLAVMGYPGIRVDVADPGIVNTNMIRLGKWFDPLTDVFFRPICNSPLKGVTPALNALADARPFGPVDGGSTPITAAPLAFDGGYAPITSPDGDACHRSSFEEQTVRYFVGKGWKPVPKRYLNHPRRIWLWEELMKRI